ncbi:DUF2637 domain-containing protein [Streptomyces sp. bgisy100]|uniref:DUF2637 domain-containing protein n=1 Tax=Streptomyces sp. bgisy100 TaxID=3413783 RepID=UPI003D70AA36
MPASTSVGATPAVISGTATIRLGIALLGAIGFALSYDALRQMAVAVHISGLLTYAFPLVIDGFIAIGICALIILRTAPLRSRLYVWALVGLATATSIWANALHAIHLNHRTKLRLDDLTVGGLSSIAPLALAGAVHLYLVIRRHLTANGVAAVAPSAAPTAEAATPEPIRQVRQVRQVRQEQADDASTAPLAKASSTSAREAKGTIPVAPAAETVPKKGGRKTTVPDDVLLATARAIGAQTGKVSRTNLEDAVRDKGYTIRKDLAKEAAEAVMAELESAAGTTQAA